MRKPKRNVSSDRPSPEVQKSPLDPENRPAWGTLTYDGYDYDLVKSGSRDIVVSCSTFYLYQGKDNDQEVMLEITSNSHTLTIGVVDHTGLTVSKLSLPMPRVGPERLALRDKEIASRNKTAPCTYQKKLNTD